METKRFIGADLGRLYERVRRDFGPEAVIVRTRTLVRDGAEPLIEIVAAPAEAEGLLDLDFQRTLLDGALERTERSITVGDLEDIAEREVGRGGSGTREMVPAASDLPAWFHEAMSEAGAQPAVRETHIRERTLAPLPPEAHDGAPHWYPEARPTLGDAREALGDSGDAQPTAPGERDRAAGGPGFELVRNAGARVVQSLLAQGLTPAAAAVVSRTATGEHDPERALAAALESREVSYPEEGQTALISVQGPAGAGRTTALVRMALDCADAGRSAVLLAADGTRVAAREQIQSYASAIGLDAADAVQVRDIARTLVRAKAGSCLFADVSAGPWQTSPSLHGVAHFSYVAIPAHWQRAALERAFAGYQLDAFAGAIVTCTDLAGDLATALSFVLEHGLGIAFLSEGRDVSTGIGVAEPLTLASGIFTMRTGETTDGSLIATA